MGYRIGSFNLRNLGLTALGQKSERSLKMIAEIIKREKFDVVALQEVLSEGKAFISPNYAKRSIMMELGPGWDFQWANAETSLADTRNEGYAFVWNTRRLRLSTTVLDRRSWFCGSDSEDVSLCHRYSPRACLLCDNQGSSGALLFPYRRSDCHQI